MFKRLKTRILLMNMVIISVLLLGALGALVISAHNGTRDIIKKDIYLSFTEWKKVEEIIEKYEITDSTDLDDDLINTGEYRRLPWILRMSAFARINKDNGSETILFLINPYEGIYEYVVKNVDAYEDELFFFDYEGKAWAGRLYSNDTSQVYVFLDVETKMAYNDRLIITSLIIYAITLGLVFLISLYLTNRAIKPIGIAFDKQKQFISDASHELRTPLTAIRANADLLMSRKNKQLGADTKWLEFIREETERMTVLTEELLYLAEVDNKYNPVKTGISFSFSDVVKKHTFGMDAVAYEKNIEMEQNIENDIEVMGNKEKLSQVVIILINNALKYTNEGGIIKVDLKKHRNYAILSVTNSGEGIIPEDIDKIFDRFYRNDDVRNSIGGSHGLGLAIAKAIVDGHGGSLTCSSKPGGPTEFIMKIEI